MNEDGIQGATVQRPRQWSRMAVVLVGVLAGVIFSVLPVAGLLVLAIPPAMILGILYCLNEDFRRRTSRWMLALGAAICVMAVAVALPTKKFGQPVGPFPSKTIALGDLVKWDLAYDFSSEDGDEAWRDIRVTLPTERPTRSQIIDSIRGQTDVKAHISRCGNCATLVWGGSFGRISLRPPRKSAQQANP